MIDFIEWAKQNSLDLPEINENQTRSDGYVRSQYPDAYFAPTSATAFLDLKNAKGISHKTGANTAK